ncbi:MAG: hypothetical protein AB7L94_42600 [Kofleriaceae bacterium]
MTTPVELPEAPKKRISGAWYALTALPWILAIAVWYVHLPRVIAGFATLGANTFQAQTGGVRFKNVDDLERVHLRAGRTTIYVEGVRDGERITPRADLWCDLFDPAGRPVALERDASMTMSINSDHFASQFVAQIDTAGDHFVTCDADEPVRYSLGRSFPVTSIIWLVLTLVAALPLTGVIGYTVNRIRNPKKPKVPATLPNRSV